jgi:hypothetical protein
MRPKEPHGPRLPRPFNRRRHQRRHGRRRLQFPPPRPMRLLLLPILIAFGLAAQFRANEVLTADSVLLSLIRRAQWLHASQQVP